MLIQNGTCCSTESRLRCVTVSTVIDVWPIGSSKRRSTIRHTASSSLSLHFVFALHTYAINFNINIFSLFLSRRFSSNSPAYIEMNRKHFDSTQNLFLNMTHRLDLFFILSHFQFNVCFVRFNLFHFSSLFIISFYLSCWVWLWVGWSESIEFVHLFDANRLWALFDETLNLEITHTPFAKWKEKWVSFYWQHLLAVHQMFISIADIQEYHSSVSTLPIILRSYRKRWTSIRVRNKSVNRRNWK